MSSRQKRDLLRTVGSPPWQRKHWLLPRRMADAASLQQQVAESVFEALPDLEEQELVELLDFVFQQHSGGAFNPDNTPKKEVIVGFVNEARAPDTAAHGLLPCALTLRFAVPVCAGSRGTACKRARPRATQQITSCGC